MKRQSVNQWSEVRNTSKDNVLKVANCRGKRPVMRDIKKARDIISKIMVELNPNDAKDRLKECEAILWDILCEPQNN